MEYFSNANINFITFLAYSLLYFKYPELSYFMPLLAYDLPLNKIYEHPKILQLIIYDNGNDNCNINNKICASGIGLEGIKQRVEELRGIINS